MISRDVDVVEQHIVAGGRTKAQMIPRWDDPDTVQMGRNQKGPDTRLVLICASPDVEPVSPGAPVQYTCAPTMTIRPECVGLWSLAIRPEPACRVLARHESN